MKRFETVAGVLAMVALTALLAGPLRSGDGPEDEPGPTGTKKTTRIVISGDRAVVNGDTIRLDDLGNVIRSLGSLDIRIVEDVEEEQTVKRSEVVRFGEDVVVEENEKITGDVVVFGGSAEIAGVVTGDVVVFGGRLTVLETGDIRGSAVCFGGKIDRRPGGKVGDEEVSLGGGFPLSLTLPSFIGSVGSWSCGSGGIGLFARIFKFGFLLVLGAGTIFFFPGAVDRLGGALRTDLLRVGLVGILGEIFVLPLFLLVTLILAVSLIGIPLLLFFVPLGILTLVAALFLGYVGVGLFVGRKIGERSTLPGDTPYGQLAVGMLALLAFDVLAGMAGVVGPFFWPVKAVFGLAAGVVTYAAITFGFGAVIMTRFGRRPVTPGPPPTREADPEERLPEVEPES